MAEIKSQADQRRNTTFTDQHGRKWFASIEIRSGDPTGIIQPIFEAPLMPPQKYLKTVPGRPYDLVIDYRAWKADIRTARRTWEKEARTLARKAHGDRYRADKAFTEDVLDVVGPPPDYLEPVIAASQGNAWIIGKKGVKPDVRLAPMVAEMMERMKGADVREEDEEDFSTVQTRADRPARGSGNGKKNRPAREQVPNGGGSERELEDDDADDDDDRFAPVWEGEGDPPENWREGLPEEADEEFDAAATGGRTVNPRATRPQPRAVTKGTGARKSRAKRARTEPREPAPAGT